MKNKLNKILVEFWNEAQSSPEYGYLGGNPEFKILHLIHKEILKVLPKVSRSSYIKYEEGQRQMLSDCKSAISKLLK